MIAADLVTWEAEYTNGPPHKETEGARYIDINRAELKVFRLMNGGTVVFETYVPPGLSGHEFVYRRRSRIAEGTGRETIFVLGWIGGPAFAIDASTGSYRHLEEGFNDADIDLYSPVSMPGEKWGGKV